MIASILGLIVVLAAGTGLFLETIDQFVDIEDKLRIKSKVEDFWLFVAGLTSQESLSIAIRSRRQRMVKIYIPLFCRIYWLALLMVIGTICYENYVADVNSIKLVFTSNIDADFSIHENLAYSYFTTNPERNCGTVGRLCSPTPEWLKYVSRLATLELSFHEYIDRIAQDEPSTLRFASAVSDAIVILIFGVSMTIALNISFFATNYILTIVTGSKLKLAMIILLDILLAMAIPPLILSIVLIAISIFSMLNMIFGWIEFSTFDHINIYTLIVAQSAVTVENLTIGTAFSVIMWVLGSIIFFAVGKTSIGWFLTFLFLQIRMLYGFTYDRIVTFFISAWDVLHLNFNIDVATSTVNWAIFVDLMYSMFFLVPAFALILIQRWSFGRRIFLNIVMSVAEHPNGAIYAFGEKLLGLITSIREKKTRKIGTENRWPFKPKNFASGARNGWLA